MSVRRSARQITVERDQFAAGFRLLELTEESTPRSKPTIVIDLIRPEDLVALSVEAVGCELTEGNPPVLRPINGETDALLVVRYTFQHLADEASYEGGTVPVPIEERPTNAPIKITAAADPRPNPPVASIAANGSRLVFAFPAGESIPFSTTGILAAISRLAPALHKLALPGAAPTGRSEPGTLGGTRLIPLPGGLIGALTGTALYARRGKVSELRELGAPKRSDAIATARYEANASRRVRKLLTNRTASLDRTSRPPLAPEDSIAFSFGAERIEVRPIFGPAGFIGTYRPRPRITRKLSYPPAPQETAIEAPYRLIISPGSEGRWTHALEPLGPSSGVDHFELWHSRLGQAAKDPSGKDTIDERDAGRRIVRAIWTRDRDYVDRTLWQNPASSWPAHANDPFRMSLDAADRHILVRQTSETLVGVSRSIEPNPLAAEALWLSAIGAWLKLRGSWDTKPYSAASIRSILFMNYSAPLGRDQHVEVAYPGYLYPFGHRATLVKVTDRKMKEAAPSIAALYQRKFLVIGEPIRVYPDQRNLPFSQVEIRPLVTPAIDDPGPKQDELFWPTINGKPFEFEMHALDQEMQQIRLHMPLMWVPEFRHDYSAIDDAYSSNPLRVVNAYGQKVAYAPADRAGVTTLPTAALRFLGQAVAGGCIPRMSSADVLVPAVQQLSPQPPIPICYHALYKSTGFNAAGNKAEFWASVLVDGEVSPEQSLDPVVPLPQLRFGAGGAPTDRSGGFVAPSVPLRGLSRVIGATGSADNDAAKLQFDPNKYFAGSEPKLFGLIPLSELGVSVDSDLLRIPKIISEFASRIEALVDDIGRAASSVASAAAEAKQMVDQASPDKPAAWIAEMNAAIASAESLEATFTDVQGKIGQALDKIRNEGKSAAESFVDALEAELENTIKSLNDLAAKLPSFIGNVLRSVANLLSTTVHGAISLVEDMSNYLTGLAESGSLARVQFEWKPAIQSWPNGSAPLLEVKKDSLVFAIGAQAGINGKNEVFALAQLVDFKLHLFPKAELIELDFERFSFRSGGGKPEVDVVFRKIGFHGVLAFVETFRELIPLDGFSDPPNVQVTAEGLTAGFGLALPDIAMGMFSITNMSLNADVQVPFLGKVVTVGFSFCTRERPFTIAVAFIGGGGWFGIRLSADGLEVLELGLEAGACIAVNFGVASGSVSAMLGIYIRLESQAGSLAGYFRLRGEVDVLGLITAAIELYMALVYHFKTGKLIGEATITVNVSVIGLSKKVSIHAQRTFAGANADPSFRDVMVESDGSSPSWTVYCLAFAEE